MDRKAEEARIRYLYRDLVLRGKLRVPLEAARMIVGPDCAYHLYSLTRFPGKEDGKEGKEKPAKERRTRRRGKKAPCSRHSRRGSGR